MNVMKNQERARWRCRRGMLELDIILQRFVDKHYQALGEEDLRQFEALLNLADNDLWDMIALKEAEDNNVAPVLHLLRAT